MTNIKNTALDIIRDHPLTSMIFCACAAMSWGFVKLSAILAAV